MAMSRKAQRICRGERCTLPENTVGNTGGDCVGTSGTLSVDEIDEDRNVAVGGNGSFKDSRSGVMSDAADDDDDAVRFGVASADIDRGGIDPEALRETATVEPSSSWIDRRGIGGDWQLCTIRRAIERNTSRCARDATRKEILFERERERGGRKGKMSEFTDEQRAPLNAPVQLLVDWRYDELLALATVVECNQCEICAEVSLRGLQ